jgi:hypothetical protein
MYSPNKTIGPLSEMAPSRGDILVDINVHHSNLKAGEGTTPIDYEVEVATPSTKK